MEEHMKIRASIAVAVLIGAIGLVSTEARADYPPTPEIRPAQGNREVAYDRTPATVPVGARRISVGAQWTTPIVKSTDEPIAVRVVGLAPGRLVRLTVLTPSGARVALPSVRVGSNGAARLPALRLNPTAGSGVYRVEMRVADVTSIIRVRVG
jgi:hypothetical protein